VHDVIIEDDRLYFAILHQFCKFMRKFPHYQQADIMDCGPSCLRVIAKYYGKSFSMETLRKLTYQTREGVSLLSISDAAERIGFRSQGARLGVGQLGQIPLPAILHWDQNHFVVLYKITSVKGRQSEFFISDPAAGLVKYSAGEFQNYWATTVSREQPAGIALILEPTPDFYREEGEPEQRTGFGFLFPYFRPYRKLISQLVLGFLTGSILSLIFPFLTQAIVDVGITTNNLSFIVLVLIAQLVLMISQTATGFFRSWIMLHVSARVSIALISDFLVKLMKLPVRFFDTKMIGDLRQRIEDNQRIQLFLTSSLVSMSFGVFVFIIYSFVLAWYSLAILGVFYAGSALYVMWIFLFMKKRKELDNRRFEVSSANQSNVYQLITGMQEIKLTNCEKQKRWEWERIQTKLFRVSVRALMLHQNQQGGSVFINQVKNILIIFMAARLVLEGEMTLGMLVAVQFIIGQLNAPIQDFIAFATATQDARMSLERLGEIHGKEDEEPSGSQKNREMPQNRELLIENITFHYEGPNSPKVLSNLTLQIPENKITAIVGPSGSGKTTLIKLLLGFYPPENGTIRLGGIDLGQYSMEWWRRNCGVVMQDGFIFSRQEEAH
jgi:ATP-binding cassette, subfamily B, bacterial